MQMLEAKRLVVIYLRENVFFIRKTRCESLRLASQEKTMTVRVILVTGGTGLVGTALKEWVSELKQPSRNMWEPVEFFVDNMKMTMNLLQCAKDQNVSKVISCLSTCIFPDQTSYPIDE